jgi:DNA modification methylase
VIDLSFLWPEYRRFIGIERDPGYFAIAKDRIFTAAKLSEKDL